MNGSWHFNKEVSVPHLLTALGMMVAVVFAYTDVTQALAIHEVRIVSNEVAVSSIKTDIASAIADLKYEVRALRTDMNNQNNQRKQQ